MARPTLADLIDAACRITLYSPEDIKGHRRWRPLTRVRFAVITLAYDGGAGPISQHEIGRRLNGRDHATISHAIKVANRLIDEGDKGFAMLVSQIRASAQRAVDERVRRVSEALRGSA